MQRVRQRRIAAGGMDESQTGKAELFEENQPEEVNEPKRSTLSQNQLVKEVCIMDNDTLAKVLGKIFIVVFRAVRGKMIHIME